MSQQPPDSPRDLHVRTALLEQALIHSEEMAERQHETTLARQRATDEQVGRIATQLSADSERLRWLEGWAKDMSRYLQQQAAEVEGIGKRQSQAVQTADRIRYGIAAAMIILAIVAGVSPEHLGKVTKMLALIP